MGPLEDPPSGLEAAGYRLRAHSLRDIFDAIFYVLRSGCPWRMLDGDLPPWSTLYYHFRRFPMSGIWRRIFVVLHAAERKRVGKDPDASAAITWTPRA